MNSTRVLACMVLAAGLLDAAPAAACACGGVPRAPCQLYWQVSAVFAGRVIDIRPTPDQPLLMVVRFAVEHRGQGIETDLVEMEVSSGMCGYAFQVGERYFVYARPDASGRLSTSPCLGTKPLAEAAADLAFLQALSTWPPGPSLLGYVWRDAQDLLSSVGTGHGVAGAHVRVSGVRGSGGEVSREAVTGEDGRWEVRNLPHGTYTVDAALPPGLVLARPPQPVVQPPLPPRAATLTHPSQCAEFGWWPSTDAQIAGVVLTPDGRPARDEPITLIAAANVRHQEERVLHFTVRTDADGRFTFAHLAPGPYVVGVNLERSPPSRELDRRVYHPGTTDPAHATIVTVGPGSRVQLAPLTLPRWPSDRQITGRVVWADGRPAPGATLFLYGRYTRTAVPLDDEGRFSVAVPYGDTYSLAAYEDPAPPVLLARAAQQYIGRYDRGVRMTLTLRRP